MATEECDPDLVKKPMPASMPKMAAAPQPAPAPAPTPIRPMPKRISLSADDLFDFNSAALKPSGMAMLDNLVRDLNGTQHDSISLTGHADRIGSLIYNQKLSERRAQSVKTYLESKGIAGKIITASGVGKTQPTAETAACKGKISKRLITCLQPDRRVDVEISGMKPQ